jgi:catechol 2,3-dioxygenase-like lactoylglutathione lyase family enzyme
MPAGTSSRFHPGDPSSPSRTREATQRSVPGTHPLLPVPGRVASLCELTLETVDKAALEGFYADLLGFEVLSRDEDRIWLAVGDSARLGLWTPGRKEFGDRGGAHVHFALAAHPGELDRMTERLRSHDVEMRGPIEHNGGDRSIYVEDPAGNVVEIWDFFHRHPGAQDGVDALKQAGRRTISFS